jgi:hypothetical protein
VTPEVYRARITALEEQAAREVSARVKAVALLIHPLPVSDAYVHRLIHDSDISRALAAQVEALEAEFYQL